MNFIENTINTQLPYAENEFFKISPNSPEYAGIMKRTNVSFITVTFFQIRQLINSKPVSSKLAINEKNKILSCRKRLLKRIKDCIKHIFIHPKKTYLIQKNNISFKD